MAQSTSPERRPRGRPRSDTVELIESALLDGALEHFLRNGYGGTSMAAIVRSLGISKTTLYSRYPSKAALFQAIIEQQTDRQSPGTTLHLSRTDPSLEEGLRAYGRRMIEASFEGDLLQVNRLIYSESHRFPELGVAAAERTMVGIRQVGQFIAECAEREAIPCRDPEAIATAFIFMLRGWYVNLMLTDQTVSRGTVSIFVDQAIRTLIAGRADW